MAKRAWPDGPLEDWPDAKRVDYVKTLTKRVQEYIAYLEHALDEVEEDLEAEARAQTYDELLAGTWGAIGVARTFAGDDEGALRAYRAATILKSA